MGICSSRPNVMHDSYDNDYAPTNQVTTFQSSDSTPARQSIEQESPSRVNSSNRLPARVDEKLRLLARSVQRARELGIDTDLCNYGEQTARYLSGNKQPDERILSLDIENFDRLAASYNSRYPDLVLRHMDSPAEFINALTSESSHASWRALVRLEDGGAHHFSADVRQFQGYAPTVIVMEPANLYTFINPYSRLRRQSLQQLGTESKWAFIGVGAQKSAADCVMFDLQFALTAYQKSATFDKWHQNLRENGTLTEDDDKCMHSPDAMLESYNINLYHGEQFLPAMFYKHTHSKGVINDAHDHQPDIKEKDVSTSRRDSKRESLINRLDAFSVHRDGRTYSASIETLRATKIRTTLERN